MDYIFIIPLLILYYTVMQKSGVKVYILLYYESRFLPNGSKFARSRFAEPGNNIEVIVGLLH